MKTNKISSFAYSKYFLTQGYIVAAQKYKAVDRDTTIFTKKSYKVTFTN